MSKTLYNDKGEAIPSRPSMTNKNDQKLIVNLVIEMMVKMEPRPFKDASIESLERSILNGFHLVSDEYALGKSFEADGWDVSIGFIYCLTVLTDCIKNAYSKLEKDWFDEHKPVLLLPIGSEVLVNGEKLLISGIYGFAPAKYLVEFDSKRKGSWVINFEDIVPFAGK